MSLPPPRPAPDAPPPPQPVAAAADPRPGRRARRRRRRHRRVAAGGGARRPRGRGRPRTRRRRPCGPGRAPARDGTSDPPRPPRCRRRRRGDGRSGGTRRRRRGPPTLRPRGARGRTGGRRTVVDERRGSRAAARRLPGVRRRPVGGVDRHPDARGDGGRGHAAVRGRARALARASVLEEPTAAPLAGWAVGAADGALEADPARTDERGLVTWPGRRGLPGALAASDGRKRVHAFLLHAMPGRSDVRLAVPPVARTTRLRVVDPEGRPVAGARARVLAGGQRGLRRARRRGRGRRGVRGARRRAARRDRARARATARGGRRPRDARRAPRARHGSHVPLAPRRWHRRRRRHPRRRRDAGPRELRTRRAGPRVRRRVRRRPRPGRRPPRDPVRGARGRAGPRHPLDRGPRRRRRPGHRHRRTRRRAAAGDAPRRAGRRDARRRAAHPLHAPRFGGCALPPDALRAALEDAVRAGRSDAALASIVLRAGPESTIEVASADVPLGVEVGADDGACGCAAVAPGDGPTTVDVRPAPAAGPVAPTTALLVEWEDGAPAALVELDVVRDERGAVPLRTTTDPVRRGSRPGDVRPVRRGDDATGRHPLVGRRAAAPPPRRGPRWCAFARRADARGACPSTPVRPRDRYTRASYAPEPP